MGEISAQPHQGKELTGRYMYQFAENYPEDMAPFRRLPFSVWYGMVRDIPYQSDDELFPDAVGRVVEVVARPAYLLDRSIFQSLDCKKKSILIGAWAAVNGCPFCFLAVSENPSREVHHVFPMVDVGYGWETADATLPEYRIGQVFPLTYVEELTR